MKLPKKGATERTVALKKPQTVSATFIIPEMTVITVRLKSGDGLITKDLLRIPSPSKHATSNNKSPVCDLYLNLDPKRNLIAYHLRPRRYPQLLTPLAPFILIPSVRARRSSKVHQWIEQQVVYGWKRISFLLILPPKKDTRRLSEEARLSGSRREPSAEVSALVVGQFTCTAR
ncbi:hypothetical protein TNIN_328591 [Trichonephila inaurata madagascariensis]|uniref:Uncharacterized protein n=1 Tax=Trichonephila inaurata madagascariensis TaxID=2747483 RepID=A0A8X6YB80_9ARAC|nr:hypothetical protein TNIN_328591 [Trichonephila inaurata madagascariensis]